MEKWPTVFVKFLLLFIVVGICDVFCSKLPHANNTVPTATTVLKSKYSYKTLYIEELVDHFGFASAKTFQLRYLLNDDHWNRNGGPIFFYTGNEGDIEMFLENTGFMWDIAPEFRAMLVFAEHRYYGKSLPFGPDSYKNATNLNYFTSEQALADYAELIRFLKKTIPGAANSPVVAFGGSYGGMLAAWMRIKYPNTVVGALAGSAPIWQFTGLTPCNAFYDVVTATWTKASSTCAKNVRQAYSTLDNLGQDSGGFDLLSKLFNTCQPIKNTDDLDEFKNFLTETYTSFAMVDYPYPTNFIANLPGWPIKAACNYLSTPRYDKDLIAGIAKVVNLYYNYTGDLKCLDWSSGDSNDLGYQGWNYQSCTEMVMPMCSNGSGLFPNITWDFQAFSDECFKTFKVRPRQDWISLEYWGKALKAASNIIFSNGDLDPWSSGGVLKTVSETVVAIQIEDGAHHLDLRSKNKLDPPSVTNAREQEKNIIKNWLHLTP